MLKESEMMILKVMRQKLLTTKNELSKVMESNGCKDINMDLHRLVDLGYVEKVHSLGTCYVISQKGMRALK